MVLEVMLLGVLKTVWEIHLGQSWEGDFNDECLVSCKFF